MTQKNIILFASGNGSNAENICRYFQNHPHVKVAALFCNKPDAKVLERMIPFGVPTHVFSRAEFKDPDYFLPLLQQYQPALLVLSGFFWLLPSYLVQQLPKRIINIHPSLLPKYGGKGMYGYNIHEAVLAAGESETGISIHYVNERYDEGELIFQARTALDKNDGVDDVGAKIWNLEKEHFPKTIEKLLTAS